MSKDLNKVQMTGRLGADPEMRYTPQGHAVTTFRVAANRSWRTAEGEAHEDTEWFRIVAWNKLAEVCNKWLSKGSRVYVEGRLQTRQWQDQDGQTRYTTEVIANDMIILDTRRDGPSMIAEEAAPVAVAAAPAAVRKPRATATLPTAGGARVAALPRGKGAIEEEDLPF
jgi:single-strand DNA-binding protein